MLVLSLAWQSLKNRKLTTWLTILSIALSVALLLGVENVRVGARESFSGTISGVDLIVGARGGSLQLLLYAVFRMGAATNNVSYASYRHFAEHPAVAWTIPYSLGDSHRGFRVVGTTNDFYERYRFRRDRTIEFAAGRAPDGVFDVVLGSDVSATLGYKLGDRVVIAHGVSSTAIQQHDDKPFTVVGILKRTATPVDRSVYISLYGMEAIHVDWQDGGPPMIGEEIPAAKIKKETLEIKQITSFLLRTKSRIDTLRLQREISTYTDEPLQAIIPGVALAELWRSIGYAEDALRVVSLFVLIVGLLGMLVSLYTSLNERRREMAILRAIGAGPAKIISLLVLESGLLSLAGSVLGVAIIYGLSFATQGIVERTFGLYLPINPPTQAGWIFLGAVVVAGLLIGFVPAFKAYRNALSDGLSVRL
ncbi:MAG: ABC transporter permease [Bryobacteraceae bacterium]|nr:ABC transporter permease [Bryobacteraceae bacterium]